MEKAQATRVLGGTLQAAALAINISPQAYSQWPEELPRRLEDRVIAAMARRVFPAEVASWLAGLPGPSHTDNRAALA
jgi:hypothetical protein